MGIKKKRKKRVLGITKEDREKNTQEVFGITMRERKGRKTEVLAFEDGKLWKRKEKREEEKKKKMAARVLICWVLPGSGESEVPRYFGRWERGGQL